jgi:thiol-disulfide isomerase/thioredoxin
VKIVDDATVICMYTLSGAQQETQLRGADGSLAWIIILDFGATWCPPCKKDMLMHHMAELAKATGAEELGGA